MPGIESKGMSMDQDSNKRVWNGLYASVIIPTYNRREMLEWTLLSLANQAAGTPDFEVLVCDDGSSDDTKPAALAFKGRLNLRYYFQEDRGYRVASARNLGIAAALGKICIFLDCGVVACKEFVRAHLEAHASAKRPAAVIGYVHGFDEKDSEGHTLLSILDPLDPESSINRMKGGFPDMRESYYRKCGNELGRLPAPWVYFWTCNVSASRVEIERAGRFDETFQSWGMEDLDLGYRLHLLGLEFHVAWKAEAIHCPHPRDVEGNKQSDEANKVLFHKKHMDFRSEALLFCSDTVLNQLLTDFSAIRNRRPVVPIDPVELASLPALRSGTGKCLVAGTACFERLDSRLSTHFLEADPLRMAEMALRYPEMDFRNLLGMATPFIDKEFGTVLFACDWDLLPSDWRKRIFMESCRISKIQIFLVSRGVRDLSDQAVRELHSWADSVGNRITTGKWGVIEYIACGDSPPDFVPLRFS